MEQIKILPNCFLCRKIYDKEDPGGVFIRDKYICPECESNIMNSNASDKDYQLYINKIKEIWFKAP